MGEVLSFADFRPSDPGATGHPLFPYARRTPYSDVSVVARDRVGEDWGAPFGEGTLGEFLDFAVSRYRISIEEARVIAAAVIDGTGHVIEDDGTAQRLERVPRPGSSLSLATARTNVAVPGEAKMASDTQARGREKVREFFRSDGPLEFVDEHCAGDFPWGFVMDSGGRIVMATSDRDAFYVVDASGDRFSTYRTEDALDVIDPESESMDLLGEYDTPAAAFEAFLDHAGLAPAAPTA